MGVIRKKNPQTGEWEIFGSTDAKDINLIDTLDNFTDKNVEGALRELADDTNTSKTTLNAQGKVIQDHSNKLNQQQRLIAQQQQLIAQHQEDIEWLKVNGGGGGTAAPTITSSFEDGTIVEKGQDVKIPIFFSSPNQGNGIAYILINDVEVGSVSNIKQGNNTINIGKLTELHNTVGIYVKDRANMLSNQLSWNIICGGLDVTIDFDDTADYTITDPIVMQYKVETASTEPIICHMTIDYTELEFTCEVGVNEYTFPEMGIGVHKVKFYFTSGKYQTSMYNFNIVVVSSNSLYVSSTFEGGQFNYGTPIAIMYRISKASTETFNVKLFLDSQLEKTLDSPVGSYSWTLNKVPIGNHTARIEVRSDYGEYQYLELNFEVVATEYTPQEITKQGLVYRLSAQGRTNQDSDRAEPTLDSEVTVKTTLHNFNWYTNGWIDGELICNGNAYVEIDYYPWKDNAIYGSTIEIQYEANDIGFTNARVIDYTDIEPPYKGFYIDLEESTMKSLANTGKVNVDKDVYTTLTFVIDRKNKFGKIFIDGICSRAFSLSDSGSGTNTKREDFTHNQKIYLNSRKGSDMFGACKIKDLRIYNRVLSDDEIVKNNIAQIEDLEEQERVYNFNYDNTTLPTIRMYGDTTNMTLETPVSMRIKYTSPNEDKYGQSFDLPYCQVNWQGTSSLQYVLKNFTARLKDENMAPYEYTPYPNGIPNDTFCFKADYMESTHSRNVGIAKFVNDCLYDTKNPKQLEDERVRNSIVGFPCLMYINDELQGVYNFNLDRYSTLPYGYDDTSGNVLVYEVSANSDTTAGAFYKWTESSGKNKLDYYKSDFECLYPPSRAAGNDTMDELIRLIEWVNDSSDEDFRDNFERYFNKEYVLRYYLFVLVFGAVDSLGKNMKLTSFDGGLTWYPQVYDADTTIGLDNTGFLKFDMDIEMGDENVFNTTGSKLWQRVVLQFDADLKAQYSLMRQDRFTVDNIMKYLYGEQISQIPATFYNKDMQTKYLDFGSSYLYALHGSGEQHIKRWIRERIMYCDTLLGYNVSSSDYITLRSSKLGEVYLDIQTYIPMYVSVKWRDEANNTGLQTKRVGRGETVRFSYNMPTATDQEIIVYAGYYLKSLGDVSNLQPTSMLIANASRLTEITCHSPNLINTDLSECKLLQKIDLSNSTALGTGIGAQPILNIQNCKYLRYCNCYNTKLTAIYTMQAGGNLEEIYYPSTTQVIQLQNQTYLTKVGLPSQPSILCESLADVTIQNCPNIEYLSYPLNNDNPIDFSAMKYVQNLNLNNSLIPLTKLSFDGFDKMINITLASMPNLIGLGFDDMLPSNASSTLKNINISNCPKIKKVSFNVSSDDYKVEFASSGCNIDLSGLASIKTIESNASIKNVNVLRIPTSTKEIKFTAQYGDGINDIKSIWSANAIHNNDGFEGIDLIDIQLTYLDMSSLNITNAINFHLAPTTQHPNLNTLRDGVTRPYFKPSGSLDFTNYKGEWKSMFKGLDLDKLVIILPEGYLPDEDISSLFEGAKIGSNIEPHSVISKFNFAKNFNYILKDSDITDISSITFPRYKFSMKGAFKGTPITKDILLSPYVSDVSECFMGCHNLTSIKSNWNNNYTYSPITTNCYFDCINISKIDNAEGYLRNVPSDWGGHGFSKDVLGSYTIEVLDDNFTIYMGDLVDTGVVEWGDNTYTYGETSHRYAKAGIYTISGKIYPNQLDTVPDVTVANTLLSTTSLPESRTSFKNMFNGCTSLRIIDMSTTDTSKITNMANLLTNCTALTTAPTFDYSAIEDASGMFKGCKNIVKVVFKNLKNSSVILTDIIKDCLNLITIGFTGKTDVTSAKAIIDILNTYILENAVSTSELQSDMMSLRNDVDNEIDSINEYQEAQDSEILNTMLATTEIYETILMATVSVLASNEEEVNNNIFGKRMISIYATLVEKGLKTIDEIPFVIREQVKLHLQRD